MPDSHDALGIPDRRVSHELPELKAPVTWRFVVQRHDADKRGPHFDLRLGDPETGHAHSWAMETEWPAPGQAAWAIQQPTHTLRYMGFEGEIPEGYGAGRVAIHRAGDVEAVNSQPGHVTFHLHGAKGTEEYTLHRIAENNWRLYNRTATKERLNVPLGDKPKYRSMPIETAASLGDDHVMQAKIDDAHNLIVLETGDPIRIVSHRETDRDGGIIQHTHKIKGLSGLKVPAGIPGTVLRGGIFALDPDTGRAIPNRVLGGLLNSGTLKSRADQERLGRLRVVIYDVARHRGKDYQDRPYADKLQVLREANRLIPQLELPPMATTAKEKERMVEDIRSGHHPLTSEGVVLWPLHESAAPIKAKVMADHDVHVRGFFSGNGRFLGNGVGGFEYSHEPDGPIVGRTGSGLSDELRRDMKRHPERYLGMVARVTAQERHPSGALRVPAFQGFHLDKNAPDRLQAVKLARLNRTLMRLVWSIG